MSTCQTIYNVIKCIWKQNLTSNSKSEVIGRGGGDEKTEWPRRTDKSRTLIKNSKKKSNVY